MNILLQQIVLVVALIAVVIGFIIYQQKKINAILGKWAADNEVQIIKTTSGFFRRSPFFFTLGRQEVYYLRVRDREGKEHGCWVKIGDFLFGSLFSSSVEEKWEDNRSCSTGNSDYP
jgi:hypothetical protein